MHNILDLDSTRAAVKMEARQLISEMSYGPETLKVLYQAFDAAWETIATNFGNDPQLVEIARLKLANIVLSFPVDEIKDAEQIKNSSLQIMALAKGRAAGGIAAAK